MKSLFYIFVLVSYIKLSYQTGPLIFLDRFYGEYNHNNISIPPYSNLTANDIIASYFGPKAIRQWVSKHPEINLVRRSKLGPYTIHLLPAVNVTMLNYSVSGLSHIVLHSYKTRYGKSKPSPFLSHGRVDVNVTFPKIKLSYDLVVQFGNEDMYGKISAIFTNTNLVMATELSRIFDDCNVLAHHNTISIPGFQLQVTWPDAPTVENNKAVIQTLVDRARADFVLHGGDLLVEDLQAFSESLCLAF